MTSVIKSHELSLIYLFVLSNNPAFIIGTCEEYSPLEKIYNTSSDNSSDQAKANYLYSTKSNESSQNDNQISDKINSQFDYDKVRNLFQDLLNSNRYDPRVRPLYAQNKAVRVKIGLSLYELVSIDDVSQSMVTRCQVFLSWKDELVTWNKNDYGGQDDVLLDVNDVWKPAISLYNALNNDDLFGSRNSNKRRYPLIVRSNGNVLWGVFGILTTSCDLDLAKYPFDVQTCHIQLVSTALNSLRMEFDTPLDKIDTCLLKRNYGWDIIDTKASVKYYILSNIRIPSAVFTVKLKRRPVFHMLCKVGPTAILSLLNCFVFLVPVDSGEKISFGISVLLTFALFASTNTSQLPFATDGLPAVVVYLWSLFLTSVLSVILTIIIARLHNRVKNLEGDKSLPHADIAHDDILLTRKIIHLYDNNSKRYNKELQCNQDANPSRISRTRLNNMMRYTNTASFVVTSCLWSSATVWFFLCVKS